MIKTAGWFTALPDDHVKIGISRGVPRRMSAGSYRLFRKLQPGPWFNSVDAETYRRLYQAEVLDQLDPRETADWLLELAGAKVPVMVCFERAGSGTWCHRALAAAWLAEGLGEPVAGVWPRDTATAPAPAATARCGRRGMIDALVPHRL